MIGRDLGRGRRSRRAPGVPYWGRHGNEATEAYLCLCPATVRLSFGFVKVFFVRLDFHGEDALLEFLPLCLCGRPSVVLRQTR